MRIKVLAKEMSKANELRIKLSKRALDLYLEDHPSYGWARTPTDEEILGEVFNRAGDAVTELEMDNGAGFELGAGAENDDLVEMAKQS